jgi:sugar phosphate isomerase/epimerase
MKEIFKPMSDVSAEDSQQAALDKKARLLGTQKISELEDADLIELYPYLKARIARAAEDQGFGVPGGSRSAWQKKLGDLMQEAEARGMDVKAEHETKVSAAEKQEHERLSSLDKKARLLGTQKISELEDADLIELYPYLKARIARAAEDQGFGVPGGSRSAWQKKLGDLMQEAEARGVKL